MWQPATERLQHVQTILKTKLNVLTLKKETLPTVIFQEPEGIELCSTTTLKTWPHRGYKVAYLGKVAIPGTQFMSGCTESAVIELLDRRMAPEEAILEIRPFQVKLHHMNRRDEATIAMDIFQVARIAYCTADHHVSSNIFAWVYRQINDDLTFQMDCHAVEVSGKLEAKKLAHSMMEAFRKTFHSMHSEGRIHKSSLSHVVPEDSTPDDG